MSLADSPMTPSQARKMKALPKSEMNSRSPRVVDYWGR